MDPHRFKSLPQPGVEVLDSVKALNVSADKVNIGTSMGQLVCVLREARARLTWAYSRMERMEIYRAREFRGSVNGRETGETKTKIGREEGGRVSVTATFQCHQVGRDLPSIPRIHSAWIKALSSLHQLHVLWMNIECDGSWFLDVCMTVPGQQYRQTILPHDDTRIYIMITPSHDPHAPRQSPHTDQHASCGTS